VPREFSDLLKLQKHQLVTVQEQTIGFDIRLDATDRLDEGNTVAEQFGIAPQISTLELMVQPKQESLLGGAVDALLGKPKGFSFTRTPNPPMILFIFGRKRVLPVNINTMNITETEFSADLNPVRATVSVNLTVIEGRNVPYLYSKAMVETILFLPKVSASYWLTGYFLRPGNTGSVGALVDQSILGFLTRTIGTLAGAQPIWLVVS